MDSRPVVYWLIVMHAPSFIRTSARQVETVNRKAASTQKVYDISLHNQSRVPVRHHWHCISCADGRVRVGRRAGPETAPQRHGAGGGGRRGGDRHGRLARKTLPQPQQLRINLHKIRVACLLGQLRWQHLRRTQPCSTQQRHRRDGTPKTPLQSSTHDYPTPHRLAIHATAPSAQRRGHNVRPLARTRIGAALF